MEAVEESTEGIESSILIDPVADPTLNERQTRKMGQRPHMTLLYVRHLRQVRLILRT